MSTLEYQLFYERGLPHFQPPGATLFVTFRLAGSIPRAVAQSLLDEAERIWAQVEHLPDSRDSQRRMARMQSHLFGRWDACLDQAKHGPTWLSDRRVAALVADELGYYDGDLYDLLAYCVMPNHVHTVLTPRSRDATECHALSHIMHAVKGYTATQANRLLGRMGAFWQHESYDHVVRDTGELARVIAYTVENPVKAGLAANWQEWPWTYSRDE